MYVEYIVSNLSYKLKYIINKKYVISKDFFYIQVFPINRCHTCYKLGKTIASSCTIS